MSVLRDLNHIQATAYAETLALSRPHGARRWDVTETLAAMRKLAHINLTDVLLALARAAADRDCNSPYAVTNTSSPHWLERQGIPVNAHQPFVPADTCDHCQQTRARCENDPMRDHDFRAYRPATRDTDISPNVDELRGIIATTREATDA